VFILYLVDFAVVTCQQQVRSNLKTQHVPAREPHHHYEQPLRSRDGTASHNIPEELIFSTGEALFSEAKPTFE
jgi:hypothetical protein